MKLLSCIIQEIVNNLDFFSFENNFTQKRYKRFSELCIFFGHCANTAALEDEAPVGVLHNYLIHEMSKLSPDEVFENFYTAYHIILPYVSIRKFRQLGQFEKCLDIVSKNKFISSEVPPHRQMEWDYMQYLIGRRSRVGIPNTAILKQNCHLQYFDRDLAYAYTHCLFYATDFGFMQHRPPLKDLHKLKFQLECLIARFYEENDVDLLLELAINYFGLLPYISIDYGVLEIIDRCLSRTSFIEFDCNEKTLEKKYHSLFVLGILSTLLHTLANSATVSKASRISLAEILSDSALGNGQPYARQPKSAAYINARPQLLAWQIIKQLNTKDYDSQLYQQYVDSFGRNPYLSDEIIFYLKILKDRSESDILWNREFNYLNVLDDRKIMLNAEFSSKMEKDIAYAAF